MILVEEHYRRKKHGKRRVVYVRAHFRGRGSLI